VEYKFIIGLPLLDWRNVSTVDLVVVEGRRYGDRLARCTEKATEWECTIFTEWVAGVVFLVQVRFILQAGNRKTLSFLGVRFELRIQAKNPVCMLLLACAMVPLGELTQHFEPSQIGKKLVKLSTLSTTIAF
jgi:hypothetical protein